ncbi:hypothetical protein [Olivibacter domesticus]|uniref:DUF3823 domain-containing protein n=1 Tax=Olivibacter domesticus TaxID=407022 RepID=A0A1H7GWH8_OLID1|nr:hypothetical protein [Olivibacter domesticus]SEK41837.1 hypothetical protein SAMN05661044_00197 [Olivibacter domesticus]
MIYNYLSKIRLGCLLFLFSLMLASCSKDELTEVYLKTSGNLQLKVIAPDGKGLPQVPVKFVQYYEGGMTPGLRNDTTNAEGLIEYGEVNAATYGFSTPEFTYGKKRYIIDGNAQVVGGIDKVAELKLADYTTRLTVKVQQSYSDTTGVANQDVLVGANAWQFANDVQAMMDATAMVGKTNEKGLIEFDVPTRIYHWIVLFDATNLYIRNHYEMTFGIESKKEYVTFVADPYWN